MTGLVISALILGSVSCGLFMAWLLGPVSDVRYYCRTRGPYYVDQPPDTMAKRWVRFWFRGDRR